MNMIRLLAVCALAVAPLRAQTPAIPATPATPSVRLLGDMGSEGELYRIDGRDPRRPGESGRIYFNPTITLGGLTVSGNFLLSTEGSSAIGLGGLPGRQRMNQFGISPQWSWGKVFLGSFSETWSPLTWGGVRVDGAGFELSPGILRLGLFAGTSRQAVFGGATSGSYARSIAGARVGVGRRPEFGNGGRFLDVTLLRVRDNASSLPALPDSTPVPFLPDSLHAEPDTALLPHVPINPYSVTPQENAVASAAAGASFLNGAVTWTGELAGSLHSRDTRATPLTDEQAGDLPAPLRRLLTPRLGTHADVAWRNQVDVRVARLPGATTTSPRSLSLSLGLQSIGAGYVSLGTPYLPNDVAGVDLRAALRFRRWSLQMDGLTQHDNLVGQKLATTDRSRLALAFNAQPANGWHSAFRASTVGMARDITDTLGAVDYTARMFGTTQSWLRRGGRVRSISASYTWQSTGDALRTTSTLRSHTADLRVAFPLGASAAITPALGLSTTRVDTGGTAVRATWGLAADWRDPGRRWTGAGSVHRSQVGRTIAVGSRLSLRALVTATDAITLILRTNRYRSLIDAARNFDERVFNVRWSRRF
jgi:hypothetical protein